MYPTSTSAWFSQNLLARPAPGLAGAPAPALTGRERQLLGFLARGWDNRQIAAALHLERQTVRNYLTTLYGKLGVRGRAEGMVWAGEHGLDEA